MRRIRYPWGPFSSVEAGSTTLIRLVRAGFTGNGNEGHGRRSQCAPWCESV
jgi:hypothetical protein